MTNVHNNRGNLIEMDKKEITWYYFFLEAEKAPYLLLPA